MTRPAPLLPVALVALAAGCGAPPPERAAPAEQGSSAWRFPSFRGLPVKAKVVPARGGIHTAFRVRIHAREPIGVRGRVRRGYEAHLFNKGAASGCIVDTGGFVNSTGEATTIVLDPSEMKGGQWCSGSFRGHLDYYQGYGCPDRGTCDLTGVARRRRSVARLAFSVR
jgi:hypothetical protein